MPIYEYTCKRCGNFEIMQRITEEPLKKCPTCGAKVTKLISRSAFHLKGGGWYATDYARNNSGKTDETKSTTTGETKETKETKEKENGSAAPSSTSSTPAAPSASLTKESSATS